MAGADLGREERDRSDLAERVVAREPARGGVAQPLPGVRFVDIRVSTNFFVYTGSGFRYTQTGLLLLEYSQPLPFGYGKERWADVDIRLPSRSALQYGSCSRLFFSRLR